MPPKKRYTSSALKPLRPPKPPKAPQAWESYLQSFQATQYIHNSLSAVATQQVVEVWLSSQIEDIKDKLGAVFKAYSETTKDKVDKVDKTKLPELLAEEVIKMGLSTIPTLQEPLAAIPKLDLKVINLSNKLIFAAQCASKPISSVNADKSNNLPN